MAEKRSTRRLVTAALLASVVLLAVSSAQATPSALATSLNGTRQVKTALPAANDFAYALVLQPDGKLVAAGSPRSGPKYDPALPGRFGLPDHI